MGKLREVSSDSGHDSNDVKKRAHSTEDVKKTKVKNVDRYYLIILINIDVTN